MSLRKLSPTAHIYRNSRVFSLPPPLSKAQADVSDTATHAHPVHAAIQTTESALGRGDWGLKRALPLKSTARIPNPHIFIENLDSIDHIIDFGSATDHTRTLEKWQELDLSLSQQSKDGNEPLKSAFEEAQDRTDVYPSQRTEGRWRFRGPWVAGQTQREFSYYMERDVSQQQAAFKEYLKGVISQSRIQARRQEMVEQGVGPAAIQELLTSLPDTTDEEVDAYIKQLRQNQDLLNKHVETFLDLPRDEDLRARGDTSLSERGPPAIHPSAGLGYLRSHSHTVNDAAYGPQEYKIPTEARVLHPQITPAGLRRLYAVVGVNGFVVRDNQMNHQALSSRGEVAARFDPDLAKGAKVHVQPSEAHVTSQGHVQLTTQRAEQNALRAMRFMPLNNSGPEGSSTPKRPPAAVPLSDTDDLASLLGEAYNRGRELNNSISRTPPRDAR